jgi:hypothetical protein
MRQRGRKSLAVVTFPAIVAPRPPIEPPQCLTESERVLFVELAEGAEHLRPTDAPLLASYVQATIEAHQSAHDPARAAAWERATRLQAMLAVKLRLTPQSRTDSRAVGRQELLSGPGPWE